MESGTSKPKLPSGVRSPFERKAPLTREGAETLLMESVEGPIDRIVDFMSSEAESRGFVPADESSVEDAVTEVLSTRSDFVKERGMGARTTDGDGDAETRRFCRWETGKQDSQG
ncbi:MAG: hypothetical protein Ct9H90mP21_3160 [Methanobacteriota archaeon]|nr:MAG: hypothetical protein Ct9H90mP21_3160 [Euryarchaeota archaeon]